MLSRLILASAVALSVGCGGGSSSGTTTAGTTTAGTTTAGTTTAGTTTAGTTTAGTTTAGTTTAGTTTAGSVSGVWFGPTTSDGEAVLIIDGSQNVFAVLDTQDGFYQTVFGALTSNTATSSSGTLELFNHRDSDDVTHGDSFTLAGDAPAVADQFASVALAVTNDGQQLDNTGSDIPFSLTAATNSDVQTITLADLAGSWKAETSFCQTTVGCHLDLSLTITAAGVVTGSTSFNSATPFVVPLTGTIQTTADSNQYVLIDFQWNNADRTGVIYQDRTSAKIVLNAFGADAGTDSNDNGNRSFSAQLTKQ